MVRFARTAVLLHDAVSCVLGVEPLADEPERHDEEQRGKGGDGELDAGLPGGIARAGGDGLETGSHRRRDADHEELLDLRGDRAARERRMNELEENDDDERSIERRVIPVDGVSATHR